jgi:hypothetical protein
MSQKSAFALSVLAAAAVNPDPEQAAGAAVTLTGFLMLLPEHLIR